MPLDEAPNLVSLLGALERTVIGELYGRLAQAGFTGLDPASAPVFQFIRPGGSSVDEIARLAQLSHEAALEQAATLARAGYARVRHDDDAGDVSVELTARGHAAAAEGQRVLAEVEHRWRDVLGARDFDDFCAGAARLTLGGRR